MKSPSLWAGAKLLACTCHDLASQCLLSGSPIPHLVFPVGKLLAFCVGCFFIKSPRHYRKFNIPGAQPLNACSVCFVTVTTLNTPAVRACVHTHAHTRTHFSTWPRGAGSAPGLYSEGAPSPHLVKGPGRFPRTPRTSSGAKPQELPRGWEERRAVPLLRSPQSSA